ncbi:hypothetical protein PLCT2_02282 [Planctomycetaceae bacterium]|nr:hypothetical protein PLCT2_02282 [Planctomycetaceae bacterium]
MDPIILCTWYQMDKHGWFVRDMGRVFDAFTNELHVGGFFLPHAKSHRVRVSLWRITATGAEIVGGTRFVVPANQSSSELFLKPIQLESKLYPAIYDLELAIAGGAMYETSFETRNR